MGDSASGTVFRFYVSRADRARSRLLEAPCLHDEARTVETGGQPLSGRVSEWKVVGNVSGRETFFLDLSPEFSNGVRTAHVVADADLSRARFGLAIFWRLNPVVVAESTCATGRRTRRLLVVRTQSPDCVHEFPGPREDALARGARKPACRRIVRNIVRTCGRPQDSHGLDFDPLRRDRFVLRKIARLAEFGALLAQLHVAKFEFLYHECLLVVAVSDGE